MVKKRMTPEDDKIGGWLSAALDDDSVCKEMKIDIINWFDTFEYRAHSEISTIEHIVTHAESLDW